MQFTVLYCQLKLNFTEEGNRPSSGSRKKSAPIRCWLPRSIVPVQVTENLDTFYGNQPTLHHLV
jgi:hypothetical protein